MRRNLINFLTVHIINFCGAQALMQSSVNEKFNFIIVIKNTIN